MTSLKAIFEVWFISPDVASLLNGQEFYPQYGDNSFSAVFRYFGELQHHAVSFDSIYPQHKHSRDFIALKFRESLIPKCICVYEVYNPGYLRAVYGALVFEDGKDDGWKLLWTAGAEPYMEADSYKLTCELESSGRLINAICLEFDCEKAPYYTEIDFVELVGYSTEAGTVNPVGIESSVDGSLNDVITISKGMESLDVKGDDEKAEGTNYFLDLPDHIILHIMRYLSVHDLIRASHTSQRLYRLANDYSLHKICDFRPFWLQLDDRLMTTFNAKCRSHMWNPNYVSFAWCYKLTADSINSFVSMCSNMKSLNLSNLDPQTVQNMDFTLIRDACPSFTSLNIRLNNNPTENIEWNFLSPLKGLHHLSFESVKIHPRSLQEFFRWIASNENLTFLSLDQFEPRMSPNSSNNLLELLATNCKNLQSLNLCRSGLNHLSFIILARMKKLNSLDAGWSFNADTTSSSDYNNALCQMFNSNRRTYKKVFFTASRIFTSDTLQCLAETQPYLEVIDLLGISIIKFPSLDLLFRRCPKLKYVDVSYCSQLSNIEIVHLIRKYPHVNIKRAHNSKETEDAFLKAVRDSKSNKANPPGE